MAIIAAPRTPRGRSIIDRIDAVIFEIKKPVALKYMKFLPSDSQDEYLKVSGELLGY